MADTSSRLDWLLFALLGAIWGSSLGEQVDARVVVGTVLIVGGVAVVNLRRSRAPNPRPTGASAEA